MGNRAVADSGSLRPRLRDPNLDAALLEDGYVVIPGAARSRVRALRQVHRSAMGRVPAGFDSTFYRANSVKRDVNTRLLEALAPVLADLLAEYRPLLVNFVTKGRSPDGAMPPHQDWTFVEEPDASSLNVWIPLVDVDHRNGAMSVLPGGHLMPPTLRGTDTPNAFREIEELALAHMVELPMRAGDVLVYDHRLLHATPPNRRRRPRIVAGCAVIGASAAPIHYRQLAPGQLELYEIDPAFFTEHTYGADVFPPCARRVGTVAFDQPTFAPQHLPVSALR